MDAELVTEARRRIRDQLGQEVESKATDEFCVAFARPDAFGGAAAEVLRESALPSAATVVELTGHEELVAGITRRPRRGAEAWGRVVEAISGATGPGPGVRGEQILRDADTRAFREEAYKDAGSLYNRLEQVTGGPLRPGPEVIGSPHTPSVITELCWLNRTIRTWADPMALADIAGDSKVERLDIPARLYADITVTAGTVGAPGYREQGGSGEGVVIGVLDSEIALSHPALDDRVVQRANYTREPWGNPDVHGTAVAGIAASADPAHQGMAPDANIYNYKVLATNRFLNGDDFDGALAIQQALEDGIDIANCSWGAGTVAAAISREAKACDTAWALGLTIVKSAGNAGPLASSITAPAEADGVIVVGATDRQGHAIPGYSSRGPTLAGGPRPHVVAPGGTAADEMISCLVGGGFGGVGYGTSYAAPHVSGLVALVLHRSEGLTPDDVRDLLIASCVPLAGFDQNDQGAGLVQAGNFPP